MFLDDGRIHVKECHVWACEVLKRPSFQPCELEETLSNG